MSLSRSTEAKSARMLLLSIFLIVMILMGQGQHNDFSFTGESTLTTTADATNDEAETIAVEAARVPTGV